MYLTRTNKNNEHDSVEILQDVERVSIDEGHRENFSGKDGSPGAGRTRTIAATMSLRRMFLSATRSALSWFGVAVVRAARLRQLQIDVDMLKARLTDSRGSGTSLRDGAGGSNGAPTGERKRPAVGVQDWPYWPQRLPFPKFPGLDDFARSVRIVDVGAQPLEFEEDVYAPLLEDGSCAIVGFDPFIDKPRSEEVKGEDGAVRARRRILPLFIGDGEAATFHVNASMPTSSLLPTNTELAAQFTSLAEICRTERELPVRTVRLDDVPEIEGCDFLKVDVQGGDYDVVASGTRLLKDALFVHIETEFAPLYADQKLFADIDVLLRGRGFELADLVKFGWNNYKALPSELFRSRLLWADAIYMKAPARLAGRDPQLLLRAAFIAHANYRKYDLAAHLVALYDSATGADFLKTYLEKIPGAAR